MIEASHRDRIKDLKSHLVKRVHELNSLIDNKPSADKYLLARTIETNIKIYEHSFGEFPDKESLKLERAYVSRKAYQGVYGIQ